MLEMHEQISTDNLPSILKQLIDAISRAPEGSLGLKEIYNQSLIGLQSATGIERASILLFDPDGVMRFKSWLGISDNYRKAVEGHTPWGQNDVDPPPIIISDIFQDKELVNYYATFSNENIRALAFIPLLYRRKVIGKFMLYSRIPYKFTEEINPASTIAQLVAYAVVKHKIESKLSLSENRLKATLEKEKEARIEAEKSIELRDDFLSIASHELKTPLTPIMMNFYLVQRYLESLKDDLPKAAALLKLFKNIDHQFNRFLKLVDNLLDVSRITADRLILNKENFSLSNSLIELSQRYKPEFDNLGYKVTLNIADGVSGYWDRIRIEQVINNLISNAIKYGLNKPIEISLSKDIDSNGQSIAKLSVHDHGIGISKENHEKIFSRFERASSIENFGGLGLGLFISSNIVKAHEGKIFVESTPGEGSRFTIELPANNPQILVH